MSLVRPVVRMCTVLALKNNTIAEDRVYDSDNTPLADALTLQAKPYITVYTDEDNKLDINNMDLMSNARNLSLVIEFGVASAVATENSGVQVKIPATDEGMEVSVDYLETQIMSALLDPHNEWSEIWRNLVMKVVTIRSPRGGSADRSARWAARQLLMVCDTVSDQPPGVVVDDNHPLKRFVALAGQQSPPLPAANLIGNFLNATAAPEWRQVQAWLGLTKEGIEAIGQAPIIDEEEPSRLEEIIPQQSEWPINEPSPSDDEFD